MILSKNSIKNNYGFFIFILFDENFKSQIKNNNTKHFSITLDKQKTKNITI